MAAVKSAIAPCMCCTFVIGMKQKNPRLSILFIILPYKIEEL